MNVHGGKGICLRPNNYVGRAYQLVPVAIIVEGANMLTRSMIIFGHAVIPMCCGNWKHRAWLTLGRRANNSIRCCGSISASQSAMRGVR
ncbi:MAG: hypothetical protein ABIP64_04440 [Burkholderiales bacterium]